MQTAVKFFDLPAKGSIGVVDKIAIKLSGGKNTELEPTDMQFMAVMGALMQIAPEKMEASFEQLDWVPLEGEGKGYVPLIDLTNGQDFDSGVLDLLLGKAPETESISPASADHFANNVSEPAPNNASELVLNQMGEPVSNNASELVHNEVGEPVSNSAIELALSKMAEAAPNKTDELAPGNAGEEELVKAGQPAPNKVSAPALNKNSVPAADFKPASEPAVFPGDLAEGAVKTDAALAAKSGPGPNKGVSNPAHPEIDPPLSNSPQAVSAEAEEPHAGQQTEGKTEMARFLASQGSSAPGGSNDQNTESAFGKTIAPKNQDSEGPAAKFKIFGNDNEHVQTPQHPGKDGDSMSSVPGAENQTDGLRTDDGKSPLQRLFSHNDGAVLRNELTVAAEKEVTTPSREMQNDVMRQIVQRMTLRSSGLKSQMNIHLKPEFLGNVHMQISTENHQVAVRMTAESLVVKEMIEQHLQHLRSELQQHGLEIGKFEVQVGNGNENWKSGQENAGFRQAMQQKRSGAQFNRQDRGRQNPMHSTPADRVSGPGPGSGEIDYFV